MFRTKGMHGFTLYPDRAYLEIEVQLYNRTARAADLPVVGQPGCPRQRRLPIGLPARRARRDGSRQARCLHLPIATGTYYKVNYAPGTDISRYKNIPVPTSYMAYHSDFDFMGVTTTAAGRHDAYRQPSCGAGQETVDLGHGDFGQAWDRQLTDEDGPYIELMCGATPTTSPISPGCMPGEEKRFTQVFMPYKGSARPATPQRRRHHLEIGNPERRKSAFT
jgi:hypothetical protein